MLGLVSINHAALSQSCFFIKLLLLLARIGCNVCVFTSCCFLAKFVRPSLKLIKYIKEKIQDADSQNVFLEIVFICSMENVVCDCAASLVVSKEMKWSYEKVEKGSAYCRTCEGLCLP